MLGQPQNIVNQIRARVSLVCDLSGPIHTRSVRLARRRVMLGSGRNPAVLRRRDGADDESSRRAVEGYGEKDHLVGGGRNHRSDGSDHAPVAGAAGAGWLYRLGRPAEGEAERAAYSSGNCREGSRALQGKETTP